MEEGVKEDCFFRIGYKEKTANYWDRTDESLSPWQVLLLESGLGRVEGSSRGNGGSTKGAQRSGCSDYPELVGHRLPGA